jgi:hypothetical protein
MIFSERFHFRGFDDILLTFHAVIFLHFQLAFAIFSHCQIIAGHYALPLLPPHVLSFYSEGFRGFESCRWRRRQRFLLSFHAIIFFDTPITLFLHVFDIFQLFVLRYYASFRHTPLCLSGCRLSPPGRRFIFAFQAAAAMAAAD